MNTKAKHRLTTNDRRTLAACGGGFVTAAACAVLGAPLLIAFLLGLIGAWCCSEFAR